VVAAAALAMAASFAFAQGGPGYGAGMGMGPGGGYGPGAGMGGGYGAGAGMGPGGGYGRGMGPGAGYGRGDPARHAQMVAAYEACKDKADRRACMTEQVCAKSTDAAQCQAQAKERQARFAQRIEQRQKMHEACSGKRGDDLTGCLRDQHLALRNQRLDERQKAHEACNGKRGDELGKCLGEQREKFGYGPGPRG
jgi:hypothetical protein